MRQQWGKVAIFIGIIFMPCFAMAEEDKGPCRIFVIYAQEGKTRSFIQPNTPDITHKQCIETCMEKADELFGPEGKGFEEKMVVGIATDWAARAYVDHDGWEGQKPCVLDLRLLRNK